MDLSRLLLKAADIDRLAGEHKVHFLNPNAVRLNKSLGDAVGLSQIGIHLTYIEPGKDSTEFHKHYYEEECIYVLSGSGTLQMVGKLTPLRKVILSVFRKIPWHIHLPIPALKRWFAW